jgi:hypothetical protein
LNGDQGVGDVPGFALEELSRHIVSKLAWGEDDVKHVYLTSIIAPGLVTRESSDLLADKVAPEIRGKLNAYRGPSSPKLPQPSISLFELGL